MHTLKVSPDKIGNFDGRSCFICGLPLLKYRDKDIAYHKTHTGKAQVAKPKRYFLFACPNCSKVAHKRCWFEYGDKAEKKGFFGKEYILKCPNCGQALSQPRERREKWKLGYQIPGHPDEELIEIHIEDISRWKKGQSVGSFIGKIGQAFEAFFKAVGLGTLTDSETSAIARAAAKIGKGIQDVAEKVFKLDIPPEDRDKITELKCQNCGAPLPLPEFYEEAVVCAHCGTAHLL